MSEERSPPGVRQMGIRRFHGGPAMIRQLLEDQEHQAAVHNSQAIPVVSPALCLVARNGEARRASCVRVCPAKAIRVEPLDSPTPGPLHDPNACLNCRLCAHACPVGAFEDTAAEARLEATIRLRLGRSRHLSFRCTGLHPQREAAPRTAVAPPSTRNPDDAIVVPCLGVLGAGMLVFLAASAVERISLDNRACGNCEWHRGLALARLATIRARQILRLFGRQTEISWRARGPVLADSGINRREFFTWLRTGLQESAITPPIKLATPVQRRAPRDRVLLGRAMSLLGDVRAPSVPLGEGALWAVAVTEGCDSCGACAALCPTEALRFHESAGEAAILFNAVLCTGCGLCLRHCRHQAIRWRSPVPTTLFVESGWITLARAVRGRCEACGHQIMEGGNVRMCADCRAKEAMAVSFAMMNRRRAGAAEEGAR